MSGPNTGDEKQYWFENRRNIDRLWWAVVIATIVVCLSDFLYHKHSSFKPGSTAASVDEFWMSYGIYGLVAGIVLVFTGKLLRKILSRPSDYYGDKDD